MGWGEGAGCVEKVNALQIMAIRVRSLFFLALYLGTAGAFVPFSLLRVGPWSVSGQRCTQLPAAVRLPGRALRPLMAVAAATPAALVNDAHSPLEVLSLSATVPLGRNPNPKP